MLSFLQIQTEQLKCCLQTRDINGTRSQKEDAWGVSRRWGGSPQLPEPRASPFWVLLLSIFRVWDNILGPPFGFWEETAPRDTFGMGYELI